MNKEWTRRGWLKTLGLASASGFFGAHNAKAGNYEEKIYLPKAVRRRASSRKISAIVLGAGNRGNVYGNYGVKFPDELDIVGVAEPIEIRNDRFASKHNIDKAKRFSTWEHVFEQPKFADAVIITTPDDLHHGPAMQALAMGYDLLLEKPIAQSWQECAEILELAQRNNRIVAVCHVLRYSPYYRKIKELLDSGALGELISVQHFEPIEHVHMAHSFVRGNWRRAADTNPIILAKSCHDMDILRWWIDKPCKHVVSFGSLKWFKEKNAPAGSPARCTDGCPVEAECPYSALRIYHRNRERTYVFDLPEDPAQHGDAIMQYIKEGPYGRCVYRCDNDVLDHQVVSMEFADEITANFSMEAFTHYYYRRSRIMGAMGDIVGDGQEITIGDFRADKVTKWHIRDHVEIDSGHGGGDWGLMRDWLDAVEAQDESLLSSNLSASMESHLMAFMAEKSRKLRTVEDVKIF